MKRIRLQENAFMAHSSSHRPSSPGILRFVYQMLGSTNRTVLARIVGRVHASDRDSQSKRGAESRDSGQPCATHLSALRGPGVLFGSLLWTRWLCSSTTLQGRVE